jgi:HK97 gp10 family phage protein
MYDVRFELDHTAIDALLEDIGEDIADAARANAPHDSGAGAESIHAEVHRGGDDAFPSTYTPESDEPMAYVGWDQDHFYMGFKELGTEHEPAQPFLRPALDQARI